jgi:hypothetical protein
MAKLTNSIAIGTVCGMFFFASAPVSAAPLSVSVPPEIGSASLFQEVSHFGPPPGKQCLKWTRRFNSRHGYGHRRCVHWK